ncbi:MAG TPA: pyridoxal-phosphate dependent enzyme [Vicinamibacterales bacterium]|nr:pyridoxal-phosphate dependent enzyme [Vicinamibacterales bacterium]
MLRESALPAVAEIERARAFLSQHLMPTRLLRAPSLTALAGRPVLLKLESDLPTGSFKVRGALYALWCQLQAGPVSEVIASSTGNHGAAVAYAARQLGVRATIFLPRGANPVKRQRIADLGARIVERGRDISDAATAAVEHASRDESIYYLNDATDGVLPAGPATIGWEILEQCPECAELYVPVGDSALIRGVAAAVHARRPAVRVIGVQAEAAPSYYLSWRAGRVVATETCDTIADGLATRAPVAANVQAVREAVADMRLVTEQQMLSAIARLAADEQVVAEPAAAATVACLVSSLNGTVGVPPASGDAAVVLLVTGGNIAPDLLRRSS